MTAIFFVDVSIVFKTCLYLLLNAFDVLQVFKCSRGKIESLFSYLFWLVKENYNCSYTTAKRSCRNEYSLQGQSRRNMIFCSACSTFIFHFSRVTGWKEGKGRKQVSNALEDIKSFQYSLGSKGRNTASSSETTCYNYQKDDTPEKPNAQLVNINL